MKTFTSIARRSAVAGSTLSILALLSTLPAFAADLNVPADHSTIQAAVNAASSGDTIHIAPGVYVEQVTIVRKNLTVVGNPGAVLRAKKGMSNTLEAYGFGDVAAMLGTALSDVVVKGLTFEGEHLGETFPDASYCAIGFSGSNGRVEDCTIRGFRYANPPFYFLNAYGIVIANNKALNTQITDVQIFRCSFADNAVSIVVNGNYGSFVNGSFGSYLSDLRQTFTIEENVIDGFGPIVGSEAGIVIGAGAAGDVRHNRISGHYNTDPLIKGLLLSRKSSYSIGIFAVDWLVVFGDHPNIAALQPVRYEGNTFRNNQLHLASALGHGSQFVNNTFEGSGLGPFAGGIALSGDTNRLVGNRFTDMTRGIALVGDDPNLHTAFGIAKNPTLISNLFCQVTTSVVTQPMVTGLTEQGTLLCPFPDPILQIGPAVLLTWLDYTDGWILEAAASVNGPWASASETPTLQGGQNTVTVKTNSEHQFFRLHKP